MKVIKVDSSNDQGADFQPISLKKVFQELKASVEGKCQIFDGKREKKDVVEEFESLKIIEEVVHDEPKTCKTCCLLQ